MGTKRSVIFRLVREGIADPATALKDDALTSIDTQDGDLLLFYGQVYNDKPNWLEFFPAAQQAAMKDLIGAQASAVLFARVKVADFAKMFPEDATALTSDRWVALCFGASYHALDQDKFEPGFGLRTALNSLGRDHFRSIDTRRPETAGIQTRTQNSRVDDVFALGIDVGNVILQQVVGRSRDSDFGTSLVGSDSLRLSCEISYDAVRRKAAEVLRTYLSDTYEKSFPWYGKIVPIKDRILIAALEEKLVAMLRAGDTEAIELGPPEIMDFGTISAFKFTGERGDDQKHEELLIEDFLGLFQDNPADLTLDKIKTKKVKIQGEDGIFVDRWSVYKCLVAEVSEGSKLYVLMAGQWFSIAKSFVDEVNAHLAGIKPSDRKLLAYTKDQHEGDWNEKAAEADPELHLFDRKQIQFEGENGTVEFCDLLSKKKEVYHVKRRSGGSSSLSHMFAQGTVSTQALLDHAEFRRKIRRKSPQVKGLIPENAFRASDYVIVYTLLSDGTVTLPFFSKVALLQASRQLKRFGFDVRLQWVTPD